MIRKPLMLAMFGVALSGCSAVQVYDNAADIRDKTNQEIEAAKQTISEKKKEAVPARPVEYTDVPWVSVTPVTKAQKALSFLDKRVVFNEPYPMPLSTILNKMARQDVIGVPLFYEIDVVDAGGGGGGSSRPSAPPAGAAVDSAQGVGSAPQIIDLSGFTARGLPSSQDVKISLTHAGPVRDLLNSAANALKAQWRYEEAENRIVFYKHETKTFRLAMTPGVVTSDSPCRSMPRPDRLAVASSPTPSTTPRKTIGLPWRTPSSPCCPVQGVMP
jgi:hypothetical protein